MPLYTPSLYIIPASAKVLPGGQAQLTATGGSGTGYTWAFNVRRTGSTSSINTSTGLYTGGSLVGTDEIVLTDSVGNQTTQSVQVMSANSATLGTVRAEAKQRTDLVNSSFVTDSEWNQYINQSAFALYDKLVAAYGNMYN